MKENCFNDLDDDCDGVVNNGCPVQLTVGSPDTTNPLQDHGGAGGGEQSAYCPMGSLMTGVSVQLSYNMVPGYVVMVQPACAAPMLVRGKNSYSVMMMPTTPPGAVGGTDPTSAAADTIGCSSTGFGAAFGTQGSIISGFSTLNPFVESWGINCAVITYTFDPNDELHFVFASDPANSGVAQPQPPEGAQWSDTCPANEVMVGVAVRSGARMDAIQGVCAPLKITYK
jgi:hypothetical protein